MSKLHLVVASPPSTYAPNRALSTADRKALRAKIAAAAARPAVGTSDALSGDVGGTHSLPGSRKDVEVHDLVGRLLPTHFRP